MHKYLYAHANPVMNVDPTGQFSVAQTLAVLGAVGTMLALNQNIANAPGPGDRLYDAPDSGAILLELPYGIVGFGVGKYLLPKAFRFIPRLWRSTNSLSAETIEALVETGMSRADIAAYMDELGDVFIFRGTTPGFVSETLENAAKHIPGGVTPASIDPAIATVFAVQARSKGANAVVQIASERSLGNARQLLVGNTSRLLERELGVNMLPNQFAQSAIDAIPVERSISALRQIGIEIPSRLIGGSREVLEGLNPMTPSQIRRYLELVQ